MRRNILIGHTDRLSTGRGGRTGGVVRASIVASEATDAARMPNPKEAIHRQMDATDRQIDRLVYELYGLTEEEIKIVEEQTG